MPSLSTSPELTMTQPRGLSLSTRLSDQPSAGVPLRGSQLWPRPNVWEALLYPTWAEAVKAFLPTAAEFSITREIDDTLQELLDMGIQIRNFDEVRTYLMEFPDMIGATAEVARIARDRLQDAQLTLEVYHDPEVDDDHLIMYARFQDYGADIMEKIRRVRRLCRDFPVGKKGRLLLTTDFKPAR